MAFIPRPDPGIHAYEPYLDQPPPPPRRAPRDPNEPPGDSELSWGPGLIPPHANGQPPSRGGMYQGKAPRVELPEGHLRPRQVKPRRGELRGYPGRRIAP
jgi:hypothetical protein